MVLDQADVFAKRDFVGLMADNSKQMGVFKFFATAFVMVIIWFLLSREPIAKLHDAYTKLTHEREQVALLERQVQLLERQLKSTKAFGSDFEIQLRQSGRAKPYEKVIFLKPQSATTTESVAQVAALGGETTSSGVGVDRTRTDAPRGETRETHRETTTTRVKKTGSRK